MSDEDPARKSAEFMETFVWSHSALNLYQNCPHQFYRVRVLRDVKKDFGEAADKGNRIHKHLEEFVRDGTPMPDHLPTYAAIGQQIAALPGVKLVEHKMCMSAGVEGVEWRGVWEFGPGAWGVGIADVLNYDSVSRPDVVLVVDYKTGKYHGDDGQPARLALTTFANYEVDIVKSLFIYPEQNKIAPYVFHRRDIPTLIHPTNMLLRDMQWAAQHHAWPKKESGLCGFCPVLDCQFNTSLSRRRFK